MADNAVTPTTKYGRRDSKGVKTYISEADFDKWNRANTLAEKNNIYLGYKGDSNNPEGMQPGQQLRVRHNKGEGYFIEDSDPIAPALQTQKAPVKKVAEPSDSAYVPYSDKLEIVKNSR